MPNAMPKSQYHFQQYLLGPRHNRTYLDEGGPAALDELMLDLGPKDAAPMQVEDYRGGLPDYVREQGFSEPGPRSFDGPGAHLLLSGEAVPRIPPDLLAQDWRNAAPKEEPKPFAADPSATPTPETSSELPTAMTDAYGRLIEQYKNYPTMSKPKWWQNAAGAAAGFGAGWSNAASRTKHPIDIGAMTQNVLHPGYNEQVAEWRSGLTPIQAEAEAQGALQTARMKQEQMEGQKTQREATADWRRHLADPHYGKTQVPPEIGKEYTMPEPDGSYWLDKTDLARHIANQKQSQDKPIHVAPGGTLVGSDGKVIYQSAPKPAATGGIIGLYLQKHNGDYAAALADYNRDRVQDHLAMRAPPDPTTALLREEMLENRHNKDVEGVATWKQNEEARLLRDRQAAINHTFSTGAGNPIPTEAEIWKDPVMAAKLRSINKQFAPQMQNIQNEFANRARTRGIGAEQFTIDPDTFEAKRVTAPSIGAPAPVGGNPAPPAAAGGAQKYTEQEVRERAVKAGKNADAAVQAARQKGLIQ